MFWRLPRTSSRSVLSPTLVADANRCGRDDLTLYTITTDGTVRVFLPVLDQPNYLQLHGALDAYSSLPLLSYPPSSGRPAKSIGFVLDREVMSAAFTRILGHCDKDDDDSGLHRLREIQEESWDLFLHVHEDRSLVVGAVAVRTSSLYIRALGLNQCPSHRISTEDLQLY